MVISWLGATCFKIQSGDTVIVTDPYSKDIGLTPPRFRADVVTISHGHSHIQSESIPDAPIIIDGPGEYESKGIIIRGTETWHDPSEAKEYGLNTAYGIEIEDIKIAHLGHFGEDTLRGETLENLGTIDILLIPVGGDTALDGKTAKKIVDQIEPRIVIPMDFKIPGLKTKSDSVDAFLKEMGVKDATPEERLTIKKKDLPQTEETRLVLLKGA